MTSSIRQEEDFLGVVAVPGDRYFGAETMRALQNFPITGTPISAMPELIDALVWIKKAAALTNGSEGTLSPSQVSAIVAACDDILRGDFREEFCVDVLQGGAGTSTNMNANEVIANRALEIMGRPRGTYSIVHPKDHVNKCQSTNDVYASAIRLTIVQLNERLAASIQKIVDAFQTKANEFAHIQKLGRTQLQDAVPMTVGQEMNAYATALSEDIMRIDDMRKLFLELNLGGTAIGTTVGASPYYVENIMSTLEEVSGLPVTVSANKLEATWDTGIFVFYSGLLKRVATKLSKISNDLRLLSSGPVGGVGELQLPARQPGSSIMPGKVNPVIPEVMNQVCFRVFGADTTVTFASEAGQLQLNAMEPVMLWSIYDAGTALIAAIDTLVDHCILGISVNEDVCSRLLEFSTARVTEMVPLLGYERATKVAMQIRTHGVSFEEAVQNTAHINQKA